MSAPHLCRQCGRPLALADQACAACGEAVPLEDRRRLLLERAEGFAGAGQFAEAARSLEGLLKLDLPADEARLLWRKRGVWLLRSGRAELLDAAEAALAEALRLDDSDDLSHQLWIDLLVKRGSSEKARLWYQQRLQLQPADAMAARQLQILKLSADFKSAPPPKLDIPDVAGRGLFPRMLKPTPLKKGLVALGLLGNAVLTLRALLQRGPVVAGDAGSGMEGLGSVLQIINDPWLPGIQAGLCAAYLIWAWRSGRG